MTDRTVSSRELGRNPSGVKRAADDGPVLITHRGKVSHVLLAVNDYRRLRGERESMVESFGMVGDEDIEFEPPTLDIVMRSTDPS